MKEINLKVTPNVEVIKIDDSDSLYKDADLYDLVGQILKVDEIDDEDKTVCVIDTHGFSCWLRLEDVVFTDKEPTPSVIQYSYLAAFEDIFEDKMEYDFYIASGFFTPQQIEEVEFIKKELDKRGLTYFSPKDDSAVEDINNPENRKKVFKLNEDAIATSRRMIVNTNNKDMGTLFEAGVAYALGMEIIYVCFQLGEDGQLNLMLSESGVAACTTREQFKEALDGKRLYWDGDIE